MNKKERLSISGVLLLISFMTAFDLLTDMGEGVIWWHIIIEGGAALIALISVYILVRGTFDLKHSLVVEQEISKKLREESIHWRENSKKFLHGLSESINIQLEKWELTKSEKEVAFLLIKGFSLKEIADIRKTAEKTTRAQATAIYAKSGLGGRSQLSAFFLEDLLLPHDEIQN